MSEVITITGSSQNHLSRLLSPPKKPQMNLFGVIMLMILLAGFIGSITAFAGLSNFFTYQFGTGIYLLLFGLVCLGIAVWLAVRYSKLRKKEKILFENDLFVWGKAIQRWQRLYYCYRCDGVFLLGLNYIVPTQYMMDFLYFE